MATAKRPYVPQGGVSLGASELSAAGQSRTRLKRRRRRYSILPVSYASPQKTTAPGGQSALSTSAKARTAPQKRGRRRRKGSFPTITSVLAGGAQKRSLADFVASKKYSPQKLADLRMRDARRRFRG